ncbi:MAG: M20/M25/M40 family metallo-hydrolase, partial [Brevundimonas sp.]|uniref:M20/M25/M40 family metallo-hydrolase n=1 Tax=Brevundimonas sp. TaxID=1871086 RepID=UPI002734D42D
MLTNRDIAELTDWRRELHRFPEVSRDEAGTAARVVAALGALGPDQVLTGLGGHGVAAVFTGRDPGPTVLFRAELDALPIEELSDAPHRSTIPGKGHLCGHEGHMTLLMGLGRLLARNRPARGRVVLLFQPAEEDGSGAAAVVADPAFAAIKPDWAFAIHNLPGLPLGHGALSAGVVNCASLGLKTTLTGKTAH